MKLVYICSPYAGEVERNIRFAQEACRYAISQNCAPVAVHLLYPQLLDDMVPKERKIGIQMGLRILINCEELWLSVPATAPECFTSLKGPNGWVYQLGEYQKRKL